MTLIELEDFDPPTDSAGIEYPDCDGNLMSDNTTHGDAIEYVAGVARTVVQSDPNAFSAADHLWYYREGDPTMRVAPDVYVVFGRPKGHRGRYLQWAEAGIAPQFVFEVVSPNNRAATAAKVFLYDELGVDEYVIYDPGYDRDGDLDVSKRSLRGFCRNEDGRAVLIEDLAGSASARLGFIYGWDEHGLLCLLRPDGTVFPRYEVALALVEKARTEADEQRARADALEAELARLRRH